MKDVFLCDYIRTPIGRYGGVLSAVRADTLAATPIKDLMARNGEVDWEAVDDVVYGCVNQAGEDNRNVARMASLLAGLPDGSRAARPSTGCADRAWMPSSQAAPAIRLGEADLDDSRRRRKHVARALRHAPRPAAFSRKAEIYDTTIGWRFVNPKMEELYGVDPMGNDRREPRRRIQISREDQDRFALCSPSTRQKPRRRTAGSARDRRGLHSRSARAIRSSSTRTSTRDPKRRWKTSPSCAPPSPRTAR
jgi:acetyl-CoA acyltransferase